MSTSHGPAPIRARGSRSTDQAGHAQHCYEGANAGDDAIVATLGSLSANAAKIWTGGGGPAEPDEAETDEDVPVEIFVLTNDVDAEGDLLEITAVSQPANGTVEINDEADPEVEDTVVYTPALNFFGTTTFTYTVTDSNGDTSTATVTVVVTPVNDEPVVVPVPTGRAVEGSPVAVPGSATDVDGPFPLSYQWVILDGPEVAEEPSGTFADADRSDDAVHPEAGRHLRAAVGGL